MQGRTATMPPSLAINRLQRHFPRCSLRLMRCLLLCFVSFWVPFKAQAGGLLAWRDTGTIAGLVENLDQWLDAHFSLPRNAGSPDIRWIDRHSAASLAGPQLQAHENLRGLYDPDSQTIWLVQPWNARDPRDVSVLLHELIHHRQAVAGHWYCPAAQELPAYRTQQKWLAGLGLELDVNWIAIVLEAGCTTRDFHPG